MDEKWLKAEILAKKILTVAVLGGAAVAAFLSIPHILVFLMPFVIGYIISVVASPLMHLFEKLHFPRTLSAVISIVLVAAALFGVSFALISRIVSELYNFSSTVPELYASVSQTVSHVQSVLSNAFVKLPVSLSPYVSAVLDSLGDALGTASSSIVSRISAATFNFLKNLPALLISIIFSVLASYFLIRDKRKVKAAISKILGKNISSKIHHIKSDFSGAVFAYIRAQLILMSITFVELFIGLSVLKTEYALLFAFIIAFVDAIPVFGTGTVLLPWALYSLITGRYALTVGLCILYAVCLIVRQLLEPKILSTQIGMHPLLTLLAMYVGFKAMGVFGMIVSPLVAIIVKNFIERYRALSHHSPDEN